MAVDDLLEDCAEWASDVCLVPEMTSAIVARVESFVTEIEHDLTSANCFEEACGERVTNYRLLTKVNPTTTVWCHKELLNDPTVKALIKVEDLEVKEELPWPVETSMT